jgi:alkylation response protein AidB-like acyl-CoA dehydrogenase
VQVPRERLLVQGGDAVHAARALAAARSILWAAVAVGVAGHALDLGLAHVRARGKVDQSTEFLVSDLSTGYDAAYLATAHAASRRDAGTGSPEDGPSAKLFATRTATQVCHGALSMCGERGYDEALRRAYVDARHLELYDGPESEQIDDIASRMLGES